MFGHRRDQGRGHGRWHAEERSKGHWTGWSPRFGPQRWFGLRRWFGPFGPGGRGGPGGFGGPGGRGGPGGFGGPGGRGGPFGPGGPGGPEGPFSGRRQRRGDIQFVLLEVLADGPRHGYDIIRTMEERHGGFYRPSPGSVYPTLQMLEEQGHLTSEQADGKRVYTITESGRALLAAREQPHRRGPDGPEFEARHALRHEVGALMDAVRQVGQHGTTAQVNAAREQVEATRRALYGILANDKSDLI